MFAITNCNNPKTESEDYSITKGYVTKYDTVYKDNSTEIESITRTFFYKKTEEFSDDYIKLQQEKGASDFAMVMYNTSKGKSLIGVTIFDEKTIKKLFEDLDTITKNADKSLNYDYDNLNVSTIGGSVFFSITDLNGEVTSNEVNKNDIENMKEAYNKYIQEKKK